MFDSVTHPRVRGRFGSGAAVSILLHGLALVIALWLNARDDVPKQPPFGQLIFVHTGMSLPQVAAPPAASPARPKTSRAHRFHSPSDAVVGQRIEPPDLTAADSSDAPEVDVPTTVGGPVSDLAPTTVGVGPVGSAGSGPMIFSAEQGMTMPQRLSGADPSYTREALEAGVEGTLLARCVITTSGTVEGCRILKGLPHLNEAVLETLRHQRYTPVTIHGKPVAVNYLFTFRMVLPGR